MWLHSWYSLPWESHIWHTNLNEEKYLFTYKFWLSAGSLNLRLSTCVHSRCVVTWHSCYGRPAASLSSHEACLHSEWECTRGLWTPQHTGSRCVYLLPYSRGINLHGRLWVQPHLAGQCMNNLSIYFFMPHWMTLSDVQAIQRQIVGWSLNNEVENVWAEVVRA
jgi:hypothetical protein